MLDLLPVRIIGQVVSRSSFVAMVTDNDAEVRVRWRNRHARTGRSGYLCDVHGHITDPTACPHTRAVSWAVADRRRADAAGRLPDPDTRTTDTSGDNHDK